MSPPKLSLARTLKVCAASPSASCRRQRNSILAHRRTTSPRPAHIRFRSPPGVGSCRGLRRQSLAVACMLRYRSTARLRRRRSRSGPGRRPDLLRNGADTPPRRATSASCCRDRNCGWRRRGRPARRQSQLALCGRRGEGRGRKGTASPDQSWSSKPPPGARPTNCPAFWCRKPSRYPNSPSV